MNFSKSFSGSFKRGFTLIELLVVIAIIGILATVVLAVLGTGRSKGTDSKVKAQLSSMRNQAELYTGTGNAVSTITPCPTTAGTLFETAQNGLGSLLTGIPNTRCGSTAGTGGSGMNWAVAGLISTGAWCVDSTGVSRDETLAGVPYTGVGGVTGAINGVTYACQ